MAAIFKFILTLLLIYFAIKLLYQLIVPQHIRDMIRTMRAAMKQAKGGQFANEPQQAQARPEGSVTITDTKADKRNTSKDKLADQGDYVDYEEVK